MFSQMKWAYIWFELVRAYLEGIAILISLPLEGRLCTPLRFALMRNMIRALTDGFSLIREIKKWFRLMPRVVVRTWHSLTKL